MTSARTTARDYLLARGLTEAEAVGVLLPVIADTYREAAWEAEVAAGIPSVWGDTVAEALRELAAAFTKSTPNPPPPAPTRRRAEPWSRHPKPGTGCGLRSRPIAG